MTHVVTLLLYIGSLILWFRSLLAGGRGRGTAIAFGLALAGVLVHTFALAVALVTGLTTFTLALALGWLWTISFRQSLDQSNPKVLWSVLIWLIFVVALAVRAGGGLKERRSALVSVIGFPVIVVVYLGLRMVTSARGFFL